MPDLVNNAFWYTVWDAKSGDLIASGTAAMCARRLGYDYIELWGGRPHHRHTARFP